MEEKRFKGCYDWATELNWLMSWMVSSQSSYIEVLTAVPQHITMFGGRAVKEEIKVKWDLSGGL